MMLQFNPTNGSRTSRCLFRGFSLALVLAASFLTTLISACSSNVSLPTISSFTSSRSQIASYATFTLTWAADNASTYTITVAGGTSTTTTTAVSGGSYTATAPYTTSAADYTYTLTAYSASGAYAMQSITVNVVPYAAPTYPNITYYGTSGSGLTAGVSTEYATVTWTATDAYTASTATITETPAGGVEGSPISVTPTSSSTDATTGVTTYTYLYKPATTPIVTTKYTVSAINKITGDARSGSNSITVQAPPTLAGFAAVPNPVSYGSSFAFAYSSYTCGTLTVSPSVTGYSASGSSSSSTAGATVLAMAKIYPTADTTYTFTCKNTSGDFVKTVVPVYLLPSAKLWASSSSVSTQGGSVTLNWTANNATSVTLYATTSGGTTSQIVTGSSLTVTPALDTSYYIAATNSHGSVNSAPVSVGVTSALQDISSFLAYQSATPTSLAVASTSTSNASGGVVYLVPVFANANASYPSVVDTATITYVDAGGATKTVTNAAISGVAYAVTPSATTTYTLTVNNPSYASNNTQSKTLRVVVGNVSTFEGQGLKIATAEAGFDFIPGTASTSSFVAPYAMAAIPGGGGFYVADNYSCAVGELSSSGAMSLAAGVPLTSSLLVSSLDCAIYSGSSAGYYTAVSATGGTTYLSKYVTGLAADSSGNLYIADAKASTGGLISKVSNGQLISIAGNAATGEVDGVGAAAQFSGVNPISDIKLDSQGEVIVAEGCTVRVVDSSNKVTTLAGSLKICDIPRDGVGSITSSGTQANFASINGIDIDTATDTIYMTDKYSIRKMVPDKTNGTSSCHAACWNWTVSTIANAIGAASDVDGAASTAAFSAPTGIARASDGTLFVADNLYIRRLSSNGMVDTITGVPGTVCSSVPAAAQATLPNISNMSAEPLPGVACGIQRLLVDPANKRLLFNTNDSTSIYTMPY